MRRVTMFVGSLAAVLALGAAVAFAAGPLATVASQTETDAAGSGFFAVDEPADEKPVETRVAANRLRKRITILPPRALQDAFPGEG